jgi:hypothetical protein
MEAVVKRLLTLAGTVFACVAALTVAGAAQGGAAGGGGGRVASGIGAVTINGREAHLEVFVAVAPGRDAAAEARAELVARGARPLDHAEYAANGMVWNQFSDGIAGNDFVTQYYNPGSATTVNDPTGGGGETALMNTQATWTNVGTSSAAFSYAGTTTRCPSLVNECPGSQTFDGFNDVAWLDLGRCGISRCTLGVTWYATSEPDEADMALNTRVSWRTNGSNYDVETVMLHENGHVLGLAHSSVSAAVMYAYYGGVRRALHQDDIDGIGSLYPASGGPTATPSHTPTATNTPDPNATATPTPASCPPGWRKQGRC